VRGLIELVDGGVGVIKADARSAEPLGGHVQTDTGGPAGGFKIVNFVASSHGDQVADDELAADVVAHLFVSGQGSIRGQIKIEILGDGQKESGAATVSERQGDGLLVEGDLGDPDILGTCSDSQPFGTEEQAGISAVGRAPLADKILVQHLEGSTESEAACSEPEGIRVTDGQQHIIAAAAPPQLLEIFVQFNDLPLIEVAEISGKYADPGGQGCGDAALFGVIDPVVNIESELGFRDQSGARRIVAQTSDLTGAGDGVGLPHADGARDRADAKEGRTMKSDALVILRHSESGACEQEHSDRRPDAAELTRPFE